MSCASECSERLVALAFGELDAGECARVLAHVEGCESCSREVDLLADVATLAERPRAMAPERTAARWGSRGARWAALAAAVLVLTFVAQRVLRRDQDWAALADRSVPIYVAAELRAPAPELARELDLAMRGWENRDLARVESELTALLARHPGHAPALFWRGIARRELGRLDDASADLRAAASASRGSLREHALWTLASLCLVREDPAGADATLAELGALSGEFAAQARDLRARIAAAR